LKISLCRKLDVDDGEKSRRLFSSKLRTKPVAGRDSDLYQRFTSGFAEQRVANASALGKRWCASVAVGNTVSSPRRERPKLGRRQAKRRDVRHVRGRVHETNGLPGDLLRVKKRE